MTTINEQAVDRAAELLEEDPEGRDALWAREKAAAVLEAAYPDLKKQAMIELAEEAKAQAERAWPQGMRMLDLPEEDVHTYDGAMFALRWLLARAAKEEF